MDSGYGTPCASETAFTVHAENSQLIGKANLAVWEACRGIAESGDPLGPLLTGTDEATLKAFGLSKRSEILPVLQASVAVWSVRFTSSESGAGLSPNGMLDATKLFGHVLKTFGERAPVRYFSGSGNGQVVLPHHVTVDTSSTNAKLIEKANIAVWDVCKALAVSRDPLGPALLGMDEDTLNALGFSTKSRILPIMQTGVPLWSVTLVSADMVRELITAGGYSTDKLFAQVLRMFDVGSPPRR